MRDDDELGDIEDQHQDLEDRGHRALRLRVWPEVAAGAAKGNAFRSVLLDARCATGPPLRPKPEAPMYPFVRMVKELLRARRMPPLGLFDTHVSHHLCWPWDLDPWMELNNGRTLTLFDLGRLPLARAHRHGQGAAAKGWGLTVAGSTIRYRRRVTVFSRLTMHTRCIGWDDAVPLHRAVDVEGRASAPRMC